MALFKSRNNRRSSSPSYVSTLTTLVFIALCVFGVWMLSSNSGFSPKTQTDEATSTRAAIDTSSTTNDDLSSSEDTPETTTKNTQDLDETTIKTTEDSAETITKSEGQKDTSTTTVYGDNPGHLPDDAIKSDDKNSIANSNNEAQKQKSGTSDSQISEESSLTQKEQASLINDHSGSESDEKISEPEKVDQQSSMEASKGSNKDEEENANVQDATESQNVNEAENQEQSTGQEQDVQSFDTRGSKNDEDEANKEQLREDKGDTTTIVEKGRSNDEQQDENLDSKAAVKGESSQISQAESEKNENQGVQEESEETQMPKAEKKGRMSKKAWSTQADQSQNEKERQKDESGSDSSSGSGEKEKQEDYTWYLCNVTAGADYIPCLDNEKAIKKLRTTKHFQHRERHCPEDPPTCLVPLPKGYKTPIEWPNSRDKVILTHHSI